MRIFLVFFFILVFQLRSLGQTQRIDSLEIILSKVSNDKDRLQVLLKLCELGGAMHIDTFSHYIMQARELAMKEKNEDVLLDIEYDMSNLLGKKGLIDTAIRITDEVLRRYPREYENRSIWLKFAMNKARLYDRQNQYTKAIVQLFEVLNAAEQWNDTLVQVQAKTGIGWVELETEQYRNALDWFHKALNTSSDSSFLKEYSALYSNIASAYNKMGKNDSAELFINKAIAFGRERESLTFLATSLNIAADIYTSKGQLSKAEAALNESVEIRKLINDPYYTVYDISRLASWYARTGNTEKGIELCMNGIEIASRSGLSSQLLLMYYALAENYKIAGKTGLYGQALEKIIALKDSFSTINSSNLLTELQAKFDAEMQQNIIIKQKLGLSEKNNVIYVSLAFLLLTAVVSFVIFRDYRKKQKLKVMRMQEEEKRMAEKAVIEAEEKERKRIAADLHDNLGAYANAVLHGTELLKENNFNGHSQELVQNLNSASKEVITSLRETIWALKKESYTAEECLLRIRNFIQPLNRYYEEIRFEVKGEAPDLFIVQNAKALNLVRMIQEAITNAIKHSGASYISVASTVRENCWNLVVQDDGKGFSTSEIVDTGDHNGLINLRERAKISDIGLNIRSVLGEGTWVELNMKQDKQLIQK
jgi:two-component system, NarL family, sensor kinase